MNNASTDPTLNLYNPAAQDPEQLLAQFIDRKSLLEKILAIVRGNTSDRPQQHLVLIGPRGMGKTTLLCAIKHSVERDQQLNTDWLPILFQEEQYGIGDLADFWLECLRHLQGGTKAADRLLAESPEDLAAQAQQNFFQLLDATGKRALLLLDNLNDIFTVIGDDQALHSLRALWMTDPRIMVIGAAPSYFEAITEVDQVFHDFFRSFSLERLTQAELEDFLRRFAEILGDNAVLKVIENAPERVAALRILTGGNPRLVKLGYRVLRDGLDGDLRHDLERMLDESTPFFKHRIDNLSKEARRTFDAIARRWDPVTVDDIRRELRKPSNSISVQIKRLIDEGFVEEAYGNAKKKSYQISERFYNVYYLMRHSREGRRRLRWLVGFMQTFYSTQDYKHWAKRLEDELSPALDSVMRSDKLAYLHALCAAADNDSRAEVFDALVRDALAHDDRDALDEEIREGDPVERHGFRYLIAEVLWLLDRDQRQSLGFKPSDGNWWRRLRIALLKTGLMPAAEQKITDLGVGRMDTARYANSSGVVLRQLLNLSDKAEIAYLKALELDPDYVYAWNNLGAVLNDQRRYPDAEAAYRKALELDPIAVNAWNGLGNALAYQNRYQEAETAYRKVLEIDPEHISARNNLGSALNNLCLYPEATTTYRKALELDPDYLDAWYGLGNAFAHQLRYPEAEAAYRKALKLNPDYVDAWNNLGNVLNSQRRYPEAETAYRKALELDPDYGYVHSNLAGLYLMAMGRIEAGIAELLQGLQLNPDNEYGRYVLSQHWQHVLQPAANKIAANESGADNLRTALTEELIAQAASGAKDNVLNALLALDDNGQAIFEPLLLALQAQKDRAVLYRIAREKRELVLDVMARIDGENTLQQQSGNLPVTK
jgi:tetratricopeptide (TPR) repeat protein